MTIAPAPAPVRTTTPGTVRRGVLALLVVAVAAAVYAFLDQPWYAVDGATQVVHDLWQLPDDGTGARTIVSYRSQQAPLLWLLLAACGAAGAATATRRASLALAARIAAALSGGLLLVVVVGWTVWTFSIFREVTAVGPDLRLSAGFFVTVAAVAALTVAGSVGLRRDPSY